MHWISVIPASIVGRRRKLAFFSFLSWYMHMHCTLYTWTPAIETMLVNIAKPLALSFVPILTLCLQSKINPPIWFENDTKLNCPPFPYRSQEQVHVSIHWFMYPYFFWADFHAMPLSFSCLENKVLLDTYHWNTSHKWKNENAFIRKFLWRMRELMCPWLL